MYLVGDIGGTKTNIAILEPSGKQFKTIFEKSFQSKEYDSLITIIKEVVETRHGEPLFEYACFGVAGPVKNGLLG